MLGIFDVVSGIDYGYNSGMTQNDVLAWKPEYNIGDAFIDGQHQQLFHIASQIIVAEDRTEVSRGIIQLFRYTREHFSAEEQIMARRGYAGLPAHRELHEALIEKLSHVAALINQPGTENQDEVIRVMRDWVLNHILECDMRIPKA